MDVFAPLLVTVAVLGGAVTLAVTAWRRHVAAHNAAWQAAAGRLGLSTNAVSAMARAREMSGVVDGHPVRVSEHRSDDSTETRFHVEFHGSGVPFRLRPESGWSRAIRMIGVSDVEVGDAVFDEAVRIKTDDADRLGVVLTAPRRAMAAAFLGEYSSPEVVDGEVRHKRGGALGDPNELVSTVRAMLAVARVFDASPRSADAPEPIAIEDELESIVIRPEEPVVPVPNASRVDVDDLVSEVLDGGRGVMTSLDVFEERFAGRPIAVSGAVVRTERAGATGRPARVVVRVARLREGAYGGRDVEAYVTVGDGALPVRGDEIELTGTLTKADPLMRRVYVQGDA